MSSITVRQAAFADLDVLVPLFDEYRQFYGQASDSTAARTFLKDRFEHGESVLFVAEAASQTVGFVQLYPSFSSVSMARTFVLNDLFVARDGRRKGVGAKLLQASAEFVQGVGGVRLSLSTAISNTSAQALYESLGWRRDEEFCLYNLPTR